MERYAIDPIHLKRDELDYEFIIRGYTPAQVTRHRMRSIQDQFILEQEGKSPNPDGKAAGDYISNYLKCREGVVNLEETLKIAADNYDSMMKKCIFSRLSHYYARLNRMDDDNDATFLSEVNSLKDRVGKYLDWLVKDEQNSSDTVIDFPVMEMLKKLNSEISEEQGALTFLEGTSRHSGDHREIGNGEGAAALQIDRPTGTVPKPSNTNTRKKSGEVKQFSKALNRSHVGSVEDFSVYGNEQLSFGINTADAFSKNNKPVRGSIPPFPINKNPIRVVNSRNLDDRRMVNSQHFNNRKGQPGKGRDISPLRNDFERLSVNKGNVRSSSPTPQTNKVNTNIRPKVNNWREDQREQFHEPRYSCDSYVPSQNNCNVPIRVYEPDCEYANNYQIGGNCENIRPQERERHRPVFREDFLEPRVYREGTPYRQVEYVPRVVERVQEPIIVPRNYRNPIIHWNLVFTGDNRGFNVNNFLTQLGHMARADRVTGPDLLASAIHLFSGPARNWYMAFADSFGTWGDLTDALRRQFIPHDGDYHILKEIENRCQGRDEPFILYLSSMINLFNNLQEPFSEAKKVQVVMRNMSSYLSDRLALFDIVNTDQLSQYCKRIEDSKHKPKELYKVPNVYEPSNLPKPVVSQFNNRRQVYEIEPADQAYFNAEFNALDNPNNNQRVRTASPQRHVAFKDIPEEEEEFCWNCRKRGHLFMNCNLAKMRVFCYQCGELGQFANSCIHCHPKNGADCLYRKKSGRDSPNQ